MKLDNACKLKAVNSSYRAARGHLASVGKEAMQTKRMRRWIFLIVIFHRVTLFHKKFGLFLKQSLNWYLGYPEHYFTIFHWIKNPFDFLAFSLSVFILRAVKEIQNHQLRLVLRTRGLVSVKVLVVWSLAILVALSTCGFAPGLTSPHSGGQLTKSVKSNLMSCFPKSKGWTESLGALQEGLWLCGCGEGCDTKHGRTSGGLRDRGVNHSSCLESLCGHFLYIALLVIGAVIWFFEVLH